MLKLKFGAKWTAITIVTLMMGLEPLAAGAVMQSEAGVAISQATVAELTSPNPILMARADRPAKKKIKTSKSRKPRLKSKSVSTASPAEVEKIENVYGAGSRSVSGCISEGKAIDCERLSNSKSALSNWCGQGKKQACSRYDLLSSEERYQVTSDALRKAV
jgi:Flp pilus assembly protein CpaB